jgi:hypothetical protein
MAGPAKRRANFGFIFWCNFLSNFSVYRQKNKSEAGGRAMQSLRRSSVGPSAQKKPIFFSVAKQKINQKKKTRRKESDGRETLVAKK